MAETELKELKHKRGQIKGDITRFEKFLRGIDPESVPVQNIQTRCDAIKPLLNTFKTVQSKIELNYLSNFPEQYNENDAEQEREAFEDRYFDVLGSAQFILESVTVRRKVNETVFAPVTGVGVVTEPAAVLPAVTAKLPQLRLPEFTGCYGDWQGFSDAFRALVHDSKNLSNVEKFYYLKGSLKGEPANILASLSVSDSNYNTAWELLIKRYENKKIIVNSHIREIFNLQCSSKESHVSLRQFLNTFLKNYRSLESIGENVCEWDTILIFLLTEKLDFNSRKEWEIFSKNITSPKINNFTEFLLQRCQLLEAVHTKGSLTQSFKKDSTHSNSFIASQKNDYKKPTCPFCKESHFIYYCDTFKKLTTDKRIAEVKRMALCSNCLRPGHRLSDCRSSGCKICQKKHSSLLHISDSQGNERKSENTNRTARDVENTQNENSQPHTVLSNSCQNSSNNFILLSTALVNAFDKKGQPISCRVLLDSGSQSNFITERFLDTLQLETTKINFPVCGINQVRTNISKRTNITISSQNANYKIKLNFLVLPSISSDIPQQTFNVLNFNIPSDIKLADPTFNVSSEIDMLIGCELFFELLCSDQIKLGKGLPILQKTLLGWIISGNVLVCSKNRKPNATLSSCFFLQDNLDINLEKFWTIEEISPIPEASMTKEELECERHFADTFSRDSSGRFVVQLPLKENFCDLGQSEETALNRLYAIERRLSKSPQLAEYYKSFMQEYQDLGHMSPISRNLKSTYPNYYVPHHSVEKPDSSTTKVRVVFDASCKTSSGISLNNVLKIGPTIQNDLFSILLRFRQHSYVLIADLAKMYRQILVEPEQRNLQGIVWRNSPDEEVTHFQLNTVTYGTASASFLSTRCLQQVAHENSNSYPVESQIILSDFYVDDLLTGTSTPDSLIKLRKSVCHILSQYGFELRKFQSNNPEVLQDLAKELHNNENSHYVISSDTNIKTLGVSWIPSLDIFEYNSENISQNSEIVTKRIILSIVAKIFDPLGLLGPLSIRAKIIIQKLWQLNIGWDETLPCDIFQEWLTLREEISNVGLIRIPRHALTKNARNIYLHGFADASEKAYACCIYLCSMDDNGSVESHLLCAKSRVAPLKSITLARLELCGCLLLAQLLSKCLKTLSIQIDKIFLWTDSTIVLSWLNSEPRNWKTFVSNRVAEIQRITNINDWHHISSNSNPADIISRGARLIELSKSDLWWHGPQFLCSPSEQWPETIDCSKLNLKIPEAKTKSISLNITFNPDLDLFSRFSSFNSLIRVFSYCLRFIHNLKPEVNSKIKGNLKVSEIDNATNRLIKLVQLECFKNEIHSLSQNKSVSPKSKLRSLDPFLDIEGIIRVGGRLGSSQLSFQAKHPILIPGKHAFTKLVIEHEHLRCLHSGIQTTLSHVRQRYWPINGKQAVRSVIRKCIPCFKAKPRLLETKMADLPDARVTPSRPFLYVGVDYAGPFELKDGKTRTNKIIKGYICIFICLATKAIHIELISDLSTEGFLSLFRRFVSRRGLCTDVFSDNATNFVGSNKELLKINDIIASSRIKNYFLNSRINWHFIPARSPHFGGLWEEAVKSCKHNIKRVLNGTRLTYEEFYTLLTQIEAILNSRPLFPLSSDPNDLEALTPAHFLIGQQLTALPAEDRTKTPVNHIKRYQHLQMISQHFWSRWVQEYLHHLQQRTKWQFTTNSNPHVGSLVLLREDNIPPMQWPLGRIEAIHPGQDENTRVVSVRTKSGLFKRAVSRIALLPIED